MDYQLEVVTVPVRDVDRALAFYTEQVGFTLDVDYHPVDNFRVVQLTPPGSACSVQFGVGLTEAGPGTAHGLYLVVRDLQRARHELTARGVPVSEIRHKSPKQTWQGDFRPGIDPEHGDYASSAELTDPDGNTWTLQERNYAAGRS